MQFLRRTEDKTFRVCDFFLKGEVYEFSETGEVVEMSGLQFLGVKSFTDIPSHVPLESPAVEKAERLKADFVLIGEIKKEGGYVMASFFERKQVG
jgi:hypothetical protein